MSKDDLSPGATSGFCSGCSTPYILTLAAPQGHCCTTVSSAPRVIHSFIHSACSYQAPSMCCHTESSDGRNRPECSAQDFWRQLSTWHLLLKGRRGPAGSQIVRCCHTGTKLFNCRCFWSFLQMTLGAMIHHFFSSSPGNQDWSVFPGQGSLRRSLLLETYGHLLPGMGPSLGIEHF